MDELAKIKQQVCMANKRTNLINKLAHKNITEKQYDMVRLGRTKTIGFIVCWIGIISFVVVLGFHRTFWTTFVPFIDIGMVLFGLYLGARSDMKMVEKANE